jgi:hypothetical protein
MPIMDVLHLVLDEITKVLAKLYHYPIMGELYIIDAPKVIAAYFT